MAKKLNKKVAIIGIIAVSVVLVLGIAAFSVQKWRKNPSRHVAKAEKYLAENDIENAAKQYVGAFSKSKKKEKQIEYLNKAAGLFEQISDWDSVMGCLNKLITVDTQDWQAREKIIDYLKERADSGEVGIWTAIEKNVSDYIDLKNQNGEDIDGKYYYLKGKALFVTASLGGTKDIKTTIDSSIEMLEKAVEANNDEDGSDAYLQLALAHLLQGQNQEDSGILDAAKQAHNTAEEILQKYADANPNNPKAETNLLSIKTRTTREETLAGEAEYQRLNEKYPNNPSVLSATLNFYDSIGMKQKAYKTVQELLTLEPSDETINYQIAAARLGYENYLITNEQASIEQAIKIAESALLDPKAQDGKAKTRAANINRKYMLTSLLAQIYIEQALIHPDKKDEFVAKAEENIHAIKQIVGSAEDPQIIKWDGLANYAKGNYTEGLKQMYSAYDKIKTSGKSDSFLSFMLAQSYMNTSEIGAVNEFLSSSFADRNFLFTRPKVLLQFIPMIARGNPNSAITALDTYEMIYGQDSSSKLLRVQSHLLAGQIEQAEEIIKPMPQSDPNTIALEIAVLNAKLRQQSSAAGQLQANVAQGQTGAEHALKNVDAEIKQLQEKQANLVLTLIEMKTENISMNYFTSLIDHYISNNQIIKAGDVMKKFKQMYPNEPTVGVYDRLLLETEPNNIPQDKISEITKQVFMDIEDPIKKHLNLAKFYMDRNDANNAISEFKAILAVEPNNSAAVDNLYEIAINKNDKKTIEELTATAEKFNLDQCNGLFYSARMSIVNQEYEKALEKLDKCIAERPVFSLAMFMRSKVHTAMNNYDSAITDATKAISINPVNREYAKNLAVIFYQRNMSLGDNVSQEQVTEAKTAIKQAFGLNPSDPSLQLLYADYIGQSEPENAVALLQSLQKQAPSVETANRIAITAMRIAGKTNPPVSVQTRDAMLQIAESSLKQALELEPSNQSSMRLYTELLQATGRQEDAQSIAAKDPQLLWRYYVQNGKYEQAKEILFNLYKEDAKNEEVLSGLLLVAEKALDVDSVKKYSEALVALKPDDVEKKLFQIRSYIEVNLLDEAEKKLANFREKFPQEARGLLLNALVDMRNSKLDKALELVNEALKFDTENSQAWRLRGEIYYLLADFEKAIDDLKKAKSITSTPEIRIALAKAYIQNDQERDAVTELQVAIKDPQTPIAGWLLLENLNIKAGNRMQIEEFYAETFKVSGNNPFWQNKFAAYLFSKQDYAKAKELYLQSWNSSEKQNIDAFVGYLNVLVQAKEYDQVILFASKEIDGKFAIPALVYTAQAKFALGNSQESDELFLNALSKSSGNFYSTAETISKIASIISVEQATNLLNKAIAAEPDSKPLKYGLFTINITEEKFDAAIKIIDDLLAIVTDEDEKNFLKQNKTDALQTAYQKNGQEIYLTAVIKEYEQILSQNQNDLRTLNNAAYILAQSGKQINKAMQYAEKVYNAVPNNPGIMDTYAYVLIKKGDYQKALDLLLKSKQIFEKQSAFAPADLYEHLGLANEKLGNKEMALSAYRQALEVGKDTLPDKDVQRIEKSIESLESN